MCSSGKQSLAFGYRIASVGNGAWHTSARCMKSVSYARFSSHAIRRTPFGTCMHMRPCRACRVYFSCGRVVVDVVPCVCTTMCAHKVVAFEWRVHSYAGLACWLAGWLCAAVRTQCINALTTMTTTTSTAAPKETHEHTRRVCAFSSVRLCELGCNLPRRMCSPMQRPQILPGPESVTKHRTTTTTRHRIAQSLLLWLLLNQLHKAVERSPSKVPAHECGGWNTVQTCWNSHVVLLHSHVVRLHRVCVYVNCRLKSAFYLMNCSRRGVVSGVASRWFLDRNSRAIRLDIGSNSRIFNSRD